MRYRASALLLLAFFMTTASVLAAIPQTIAFQGQLTDQNGQPTSGAVTVVFRLYDALTGGARLWEETQTVAVTQGLFSTLLGSVTPLALAFDQPYWVELQVGAEVLSPRQPLASSPYALRAKTVESLSASTNGNVGIGTTGPAAKLQLVESGNTQRPLLVSSDSNLGTAGDYVGMQFGGGAAGTSIVGNIDAYTFANANTLSPSLIFSLIKSECLPGSIGKL